MKDDYFSRVIVVYVFVFIYTFALFSTYSGLIFANKEPSGPDIQGRLYFMLKIYMEEEPGHHEGLQNVKIVMVDPVDDPRTSATPILSETVKRPSTGTTITLLTP